jgi:hypothetical protein
MNILSRRLQSMIFPQPTQEACKTEPVMNSSTLPSDFAEKSDTMTATWTTNPSKLIATYVDQENKFWYAIAEEANGKMIIRKMSITRDISHARQVNIKAKTLIGKEVYFGVTRGWNPMVWFNDVKEINTTTDF